MHVKALPASVATLAWGVLAACGSSSPIEVIVEPGITAIRESNALACSSDLESLLLAVEAYTMLNVDSPTAESDLVPDYLRSESQLYDLVDGQPAPAPGSGCPDPSVDATGALPDTTANDDPARVSDCLARFKTVSVAIEAYFALNGTGAMPTEQALIEDGLLRALDEAYDVDQGGQVVAVPGGICDGVELVPVTSPPVPTGPGPLPANVRECEQQLKLLEVAMEAYSARIGVPALAESDLVPDLMRREASGYDIVDGAIVPAPDSICPPI